MKLPSILLLSFLMIVPTMAQDKPARPSYDKKVFNLGATIGFNSSFPIIKSITLEEVDMEDISVNYKVGHFASLFCRVNLDRFFIQPAFSWQYTEADIRFSIPSDLRTGIIPSSSGRVRLEMEKRALQVPVQIGYHLVREGPYGLCLMAGPTLKYNYEVSYKSVSPEEPHEFINEDNPFGLNIAIGASVQIWQLFFDFCYDFGVNRTESDFRSKGDNITSNSLQMRKRTNIMSISLGIVF